MVDAGSIGATYRVEAEKAKHRAIGFAVVLVFAHFLDVRPSEVETLGLRITLQDPSIVYGAIALVFGYYLSRFLSQSETGESLLPVVVGPRRIRANLRQARRHFARDKTKRKTRQTPQMLKRTGRRYICIGNVILLPYRTIALLFVLAALVFMVIDLYGLAALVWLKSGAANEISDIVNSL